MKFFIDGIWQQVLIDDHVPVLRHSKTIMTSKTANDNEIGLMLLEKAWAKINDGYFTFTQRTLRPEVVLETLTGLPPVIINLKERNAAYDAILQYKEFKAKYAVPNRDFAGKKFLKDGYFYIITDFIEVYL